MDLKNQKIAFVTGKGGVGKSFVAATLAYKAAQEGRKTLLVELGDQSYFSHVFQKNVEPNSPMPLAPNLDLALWDFESTLREYILHYVKVQGVLNLFFENKVMKTFIGVAPALKELALLGKLTSGERKVGPALNYDFIVVDAYSTGHALALLRGPKGMAETIKAGPMGHHSREIYRVMTDPKITGYYVVTLPDELPVAETEELVPVLKKEFGISPTVVLNRVLEIPATEQDIQNQLNMSQSFSKGYTGFLKFLKYRNGLQSHAVVRLKKLDVVMQSLPLVFEGAGEKAYRASAKNWIT